MIRTSRALLLAGALLAPALASAADVLALLPATGINVDGSTLAASQEVLRGRLMAQRLEVRPAPAGPRPDAEPTAEEAAASGRSVGASRAAVLRLVTLGATLRARLTVYDVATRQVVHNDEMAADAVADLDPALDRLARAYATGGAAARSAELDTLTVKESQPVQKVQATRSFGFRLGGLHPTNGGLSDASATGAGLFWLYDTRAFLVDLAFDGFWAHQVHSAYAGVGALVPLAKGNLAPYAGGGVRYAWTSYGLGAGRGFQVYATGGLLLGRLSTAGLRGELEWWLNAYETGGRQASGVAWKLGVFF